MGDLSSEYAGTSTSIRRAILLDEPPSIDAHETTEKSSINQKAVLANRARQVALLYADPAPEAVIDLPGGP
jgi:feruloyl-CoA synthase